MRVALVAIFCMLVSVVSLACECNCESMPGEVVASYDYYLTPNEGNSYNDGQGISIGWDHAIRGPVRGTVVGSHIADVHFPVSDDPKGSFGELRSYGLGYKLYARKNYNEKLGLTAGVYVGYHDWEFRENPFLQDNSVKVEVEPSVVYKAYVGADYKLNDAWTVFGELGWMDTDVKKEAIDSNGLVWNILDAGEEISLRYITVKAGAKIRF